MSKIQNDAKKFQNSEMIGAQDYKPNIAIVGAYSSGIYCALQLIEEFKKIGQKAYSITLFDPKETLSTILPTGNGRCNLTYSEYDFKKLASFYPRVKSSSIQYSQGMEHLKPCNILKKLE